MRIIKKILCFSISMCMLFSISLAFPDTLIKTKAYDTLDDVRCKSVLIYRHIFGLKWKDIASKLGYTERWL